MPKLTYKELKEWYKRFSKELYEQANIDVKEAADLGRVKNFEIKSWTAENPTMPDVDFQYAYMPMENGEYKDPEPTEGMEVEPYFAWMKKNLTPEVDEKKLRWLYEKSRDGTLMVFGPNDGLFGMRCAKTDENGNVKVYAPMKAYSQESNMTPPEDQPMPQQPELVDEPDPDYYDVQGYPVTPEAPENMDPGFLSWLGYLLGMDTDYAKLARYEKQMEELPRLRREWEASLDPNLDHHSRYLNHRREREAYLQNFENYKNDVQAKTYCIEVGYENALMGEDMNLRSFVNQKEAFHLRDLHKTLPQGKLMTGLQRIQDSLDWEKRTKKVVRNLMGPYCDYQDILEWCTRGVIDPNDYQPESYDIPLRPDYEKYTQDENAQYSKYLSTLAAVAGFAAMTDPEISGNPPKLGCTPEETAQMSFSMILENLFTAGRNNTKEFTPNMYAARNKAKKAVEAYNQGEKEPLAKLLAQGIRSLNREAACLHDYFMKEDHYINTLYLVDNMLETLHSDKELVAASGLNQEELEEAMGNAAYYKVLRRGMEARKEILEYSLYQRELTAEQLQAAGRDVLLANAAAGIADESYNRWSRKVEETQEYQQLEQEILDTGKRSSDLRMETMEAQKDNSPDVQAKQKAFEEAEAAHKRAINKQTLSEFQRPANEIGKLARDQKWLDQTKQELQQKFNLQAMCDMKREDLGKIFMSVTEPTKAFSPKAPAPEKSNEKAIAPVKENQGMNMHN